MTTNQIYTIVNAVNAQAFGSQALSVVDTQGLVSLGNTVLSSSNNTESFLNALVQRIGRTIISFRQYRNKLGDMVLNDFEYGAILQKIRVHLTDAEADPAYNLVDGQSVDPWTVRKPNVEQKLFVSRTPYMFSVTIAREQLKEAFLSENGMGALIGAIFGQVRNSIEISLENLGRTCIANMIAENKAAGASQIDHEIALVTMYNTEMGLAGDEALTASVAIHNPDFLRYAVSVIKSTSDYMQDMTTSYNDGTIESFTPREDQRLKILSQLERKLETVVQYSAFHEEMVSLDAYAVINFWQSEQAKSSISITRASDGETVNVDNIVGVLYDRDALGIYKKDEDVLTTPVNAKGMYYNTFYHNKELWFNATSENFVFFTLN